uniref:C2H2-type domain-containing protein n=1 Tax=Anopheles dirus TaxID=7168 RepID=A0A9I3EH64_9DIPT
MAHTSQAHPTPCDEAEKNRCYMCHFCGKLFRRSNTLAYHLKVHNGEYPFKCKHCDKAFREKIRLKKHLKTHSTNFSQPLEQGRKNEKADQAMMSSALQVSTNWEAVVPATAETTTTDLAATAARTAAVIAAALSAAKTPSKNLNQLLERDCQVDQAKRDSLLREASAAVAAIAAKTAAAIAEALLTVNGPDALK